MPMKTSVRRGDIVEVDLTGSVGFEKKNDGASNGRPCIVIQNDRGNIASQLTIIAPLNDASQNKDLPVQVLVTAAELGPGGKDSVVECGHIRSIDGDQRIKRRLGTLALPAMQRVDDAIKISFGL